MRLLPPHNPEAPLDEDEVLAGAYLRALRRTQGRADLALAEVGRSRHWLCDLKREWPWLAREERLIRDEVHVQRAAGRLPALEETP